MDPTDHDSGGILLPDCLASWRWPRRINPYYEEVKQAASAWFKGFNALSSSEQKAYDLCAMNLLASLGSPLANKEQLRAGCDLMSVIFVIDDHTDSCGPLEVRNKADIMMDALHHPRSQRPEGEWVGGEVARQFWLRATACANDAFPKRFIKTFQEYTDAVVEEATDRVSSHIRTLEDYIQVRRSSVGVRPCYAMLLMGLDIPDEILDHPTIVELENLTIDMIIIGNDAISYSREHTCDSVLHNVVTVLMHHLHKTVQEAMDWIGEYHKNLETAFMEKYDQVPRWGGPVDRDVAQYVYGLANCVRANDQWSYESQRYFGSKGIEVQRSHWVTLSPKK